MSPLNVGLIGCGFIGRFHSAAIKVLARQRLIDVNYVAVCDRDESRAIAFAEAAGVTRVCTDPNEIIEASDIDVVYICVPTVHHKELVLGAATRGKHIFCEKPLATNLRDVEQMVEAVDKAGVGAGVGLVLRHSPILTVLKSLTEDASLGRLMTIVFRDDQFFPIEGHYQSDWRKDHAIAGGGTLLEHSIHDIDVLRWFGGEVASVRGTTRNFAGHAGVEDLAIAHIEFASGAQAHLTSIWHSILGRPSTRRIEIFFERGLFYVNDDFLGPVHCQTHSSASETVSEEDVRRRYLEMVGLSDPAFVDALRYSLEDYFFLQAIASGRSPYPDFRVALEAHRAVDAVYRSADDDGRLVELL